AAVFSLLVLNEFDANADATCEAGGVISGAVEGRGKSELFEVDETQATRQCNYVSSEDDNGAGVDGIASGGAGGSSNVKTPPLPNFIDFMKRAEAEWKYECNGGACMAARNTCVTVPDYYVDGYDVVATRRTDGQQQADDAVTYESFTRDTRTNRDTFNGYTCQSSGTPVPSGGGPVAAGGGAAPEPVVIIVTQAEFAELPVEPAVAS